MKYIVVLADGMADEPLEELSGKTPLEAAATPNMDALAGKGVMGLAKTVPDSMKPGSDVANLSVLGYDPEKCYTGRSSLEALSVGVPMEPTDVVYRVNIVTLSEEGDFAEKTILDHSAGEISTEDADVLMDAIRMAFNNEEFTFYTGTSYREAAVWDHGKYLEFAPPHDHLGEVIGPYVPDEPKIRAMMEKSFEILNNHPINLARAAQGKNKANALWFWGPGTKPSMENFAEKTGKTGVMISAVDLLKGMAIGAGMKVLEVPGATGSLETNYEGKVAAATDALLQDGYDFAYIHIEAPDEMGHQGSAVKKIQSVANIDSRVVATLIQRMEAANEPFRLLITPDHPTPIWCRTHTADPVPYLIYDSTRQHKGIARYSEKEAKATGNYLAEGYRLITQLFEA